MSQRRYAIIGAGAIGGYYGGCLQKAGFDVHFLLRSDYETIKERGLTIDSCKGNFSLPEVQAYRDVTDMPPCDVVVVALKATQNHHLPKLFPPVLKDDGIVLLLQNGLGAETNIAEIVNNPIIGGLCFICTNKIAPGQIQHLNYGSIKIAEYSADNQPRGITENLTAIAQDFQQAGIPIEIGEDLLQTRWEKLAWNIPFNGLSALLNATTTEIMRHESARALAERLMKEVKEGAKSSDRDLSQDYLQALMERTAKMKPYYPSMKLDLDAKRLLEVEAIFGNPLRFAQSQGIELPCIQTLYQQLTFLHNPIQNA